MLAAAGFTVNILQYHVHLFYDADTTLTDAESATLATAIDTLFDFMADALAEMLDAAARAGNINGVVPHLIQGGVAHLQYADDTILFLENDLDKAVNMKLILCMFE